MAAHGGRLDQISLNFKGMLALVGVRRGAQAASVRMCSALADLGWYQPGAFDAGRPS